jgi:hypothetical protein
VFQKRVTHKTQIISFAGLRTFVLIPAKTHSKSSVRPAAARCVELIMIIIVSCYRFDHMGKTAGLTDPKALKQLPGLKPNPRRPLFVAQLGLYGYPFSVTQMRYGHQSRNASNYTINFKYSS